MLTKIDVDSENAFFLPILGVTPKDSLLIRQVTGLNSADINLFIGDYARDGGIYQGRRVGNRNIVLTIDLNPNPALGETVSGLRELLYKAFLDPQVDADYIKLAFHDDTGNVRYLVGYTEKIETDIFSPETTVQISIICPDPYLRDEVETTLENTPGWITVPPFTYQGTADTGFEVEIVINTATPTLTLSNNSVTDTTTDPLYNQGRMIITRDFVVGDSVYINTNRGSRDIILTPSGGGDPISLIGGLSPLSPWLELHSQSNVMKVAGATPTSVVAAITSLKYRPAYWGI